MKYTPTKYDVISLERKDNKYNKYMKWVLKSVAKGINDEAEKELIPLEDRQIHEEWFKTEKEAKARADFYNKNYKTDWGDGSWKNF